MSKDLQRQPTQTAKAGKNAIVVGRDYQQTTQFNFVFFIVGLIAMGGLAWGIYTGMITQPSLQQQQPGPAATTPPSSSP